MFIPHGIARTLQKLMKGSETSLHYFIMAASRGLIDSTVLLDLMLALQEYDTGFHHHTRRQKSGCEILRHPKPQSPDCLPDGI